MIILDKKVKMPKSAIWLVPGLRIKRWFLLIALGAVTAVIGVTFMFKLEPLYYIVDKAKDLFHMVPPEPVGLLLIILGGIFWENF